MRVTLIDEDGKKIGEVSIQEAEAEAREAGKNLIMVAENVYRITNAGKLKYERKRKQKAQQTQRRAHKVKEIKFGLLTDRHDLDIKAKRIREFLQRGLKTKVTMTFKGRQSAFKEAGLQKMRDLITPFIDEGLALLDSDFKFDGKNIVTFLTPKK